MADDKKVESSGPNLLWHMLSFLFLLFVVVSFFSDSPIYQFSEKESSNLGGSDSVSYSYYDYGLDDRTYKEKLKDEFGDFSYFSEKELVSGQKIINTEEVDVRLQPAGSIIGQQLKRTVGIVQNGPVDELGKTWVMIDYENAPDGWVDSNLISTKIGFTRLLNIFPIVYGFLKPILIIFSIIFALFIIWVRLKFNNLLKQESKKRDLIMRKYGLDEDVHIHEAEEPEFEEDASGNIRPVDLGSAPSNLPTGGKIPNFGSRVRDESVVKNPRWEKVQKLVKSSNLSDWKQAIIEADIILDDMIEKMGYEGENLGERLKNIEESDFITLNKAWEAHKVRNKIAHSGTEYVMSRNEVDRVIDLYKDVFEEFYYI